MTPNYDRYRDVTPEQYERRALMSRLCREPSDRTLLPVLAGLAGQRVLDVGLGTGRYTRLLLERNSVVGVDRNPHLCRLSIPVHHGDATELSQLVGEDRFDVVLSTWMTEYLPPEGLSAFFAESRKVLREGGRLIVTVIRRAGMGWAYVTLARRVKGILKYAYSEREVRRELGQAGFRNVEVVRLNARWGLPWAYLVTARPE